MRFFFKSEKICIGFSRLWWGGGGGHAKQFRVNVYNVTCFPRIIASRFEDINSVKQFIEDSGNENTRKKTQQNVVLLKEFLTLRNESRLIEEIHNPKLKPKFL